MQDPGKYRATLKPSILNVRTEGVAYVHNEQFEPTFLEPSGQRATFVPDSFVSEKKGHVEIHDLKWIELHEKVEV